MHEFHFVTVKLSIDFYFRSLGSFFRVTKGLYRKQQSDRGYHSIESGKFDHIPKSKRHTFLQCQKLQIKAVLVRVVPETVFDALIVFFDEHATVFLIEEYFSLRSKKTMER